MDRKQGPSHLSNNHGMISTEFIFSIILCVGLCVVLFSLTFTFSMAEVAQYIAFSTARAHAAAHVDQEKQEELARNKFNELTNSRVLKPLFNNPDGGWFKLGALNIRGGGASRNFGDIYPTNVDPSGTQRTPQVGVRFSFQPKILNFKVPFLGSTAEDEDQGYSAQISGLLIREPTQKECNEQIKARYDSILDLDPRYKQYSNANKYMPLEDNGC